MSSGWSHGAAALDPTLELIEAQDASDAHAALSREPDTDLILLDLALPGCDGFELLADLRREWPGMPVIVLSATHDHATLDRALEAFASVKRTFEAEHGPLPAAG